LYVPLQASAVALVATILSSGALVAGEGNGDAKTVTLAAEGDTKGSSVDGGSEEGEDADKKGDAAKPSEVDAEQESAEDPAAAALLELFLDIDKTLKANNGRLLEKLLDGGSEDAGESDREAKKPGAAHGNAGATGGDAEPNSHIVHAVWRAWGDGRTVLGHQAMGEAGVDWPRDHREPDGRRSSPGRGVVPSVALLAGMTMTDTAVRMPPTVECPNEPAPAFRRAARRRRRLIRRPASAGLSVGCKPSR
jgi:hypothetical protein